MISVLFFSSNKTFICFRKVEGFDRDNFRSRPFELFLKYRIRIHKLTVYVDQYRAVYELNLLSPFNQSYLANRSAVNEY